MSGSSASMVPPLGRCAGANSRIMSGPARRPVDLSPWQRRSTGPHHPPEMMRARRWPWPRSDATPPVRAAAGTRRSAAVMATSRTSTTGSSTRVFAQAFGDLAGITELRCGPSSTSCCSCPSSISRCRCRCRRSAPLTSGGRGCPPGRRPRHLRRRAHERRVGHRPPGPSPSAGRCGHRTA